MNKKCNVCGSIKELTEFYKDAHSPDGHNYTCKICQRIKSHRYKLNNPEWVYAYEQIRKKNKKRIEWRKNYCKKNRSRWLVMERARKAVSRKVMKGEMQTCPCEVCGHKEAEAHHDNYLEKLNIRWLCRHHHQIWHQKNKAIGGWK